MAWFLLYLIDVTDQDAESAFRQLQNELRTYNPDLESKPFLVAFNKIDVGIQDPEGIEFLNSMGIEPLMISAVAGKGLKKLVKLLSEKIESSG